MIEKNILKSAVIERHNNTGHTGIGFIKEYGIKMEQFVSHNLLHFRIY